MWYDKRIVTFITSFVNIEEKLCVQKTKTTVKPEMIKNYDKNMGGVDKYDMMLKTYFPERKNVR